MVGCLGSVAWVKVNGPATHVNAASIKDFLYHQFDRGMRTFVLDLGNCPGIDSTFIGMLYRFASNVAMAMAGEGGAGTVEVIRANERNCNSIRKLGLDSLIRLDSTGEKWMEHAREVEACIATLDSGPALPKRDKTLLILDAHEALVCASDSNQRRFCDVVQYLKSELETED